MAPYTPPEAFQSVTRSFRETAVGSRVARESPKRPPAGAQEASGRPPKSPENLREAPQEVFQGEDSAKRAGG
eukprot:6709771-Pyramimonas_sp.AAC.1